jgi:hypothetical protein
MQRDYDLISDYVSLESKGFNPDEWLTCQQCDAKPKVWIFDNGRSAACKCFSKYAHKITAISINAYYFRMSTLDGYPDNELRDNWNRHVTNVNRKLTITDFLSDNA